MDSRRRDVRIVRSDCSCPLPSLYRTADRVGQSTYVAFGRRLACEITAVNACRSASTDIVGSMDLSPQWSTEVTLANQMA